MTEPLIRDMLHAQAGSVADPPVPTTSELFGAFFVVGLTGFGGVLPTVRRMLVDRKRWMTDREFAEMMPLAQLLPGPNVANIATFLGRRFRGIPGAFVSVVALYLAPSVVTILIGYAYERWGETAFAHRVLSGLMPTATGLIVATVMRLLVSLPRHPRNMLLVLVTFIGITFFRLPLLWVVALLGPLAAWLAQRATQQRK
jgi:chromate transporter